jgi:nitrile hydratase accessory protein
MSADVLDVDGPVAPPRLNGELVFSAPWEARVFGTALSLHGAGAFAWDDFRDRLIARVAEWDKAGKASSSYYRCFARALEDVLAARGIVGADELAQRVDVLAQSVGHEHDHDDDEQHHD